MVNLVTNIDLGYLRTYNPARHRTIADLMVHYSLGQGNSALYIYLVINHPPDTTFTPTARLISSK